MPFNAPLSFTSADYTDRRPSFSVGTDAAYDKDLKFASKTTTIKLDNINYGLGIFQIQYSGNIDYASLAFEDPNSGKVSVGTEIDGLYKLSFPGTTVENIFKNGGHAFQSFLKLSNFQILIYEKIRFVKDDSIFFLYYL